MRELDEILLNFLDRHYAALPDADKQAFEALLELPDPVLLGYLLQGEIPESAASARVVRRLLGEHAP